MPFPEDRTLTHEEGFQSTTVQRVVLAESPGIDRIGGTKDGTLVFGGTIASVFNNFNSVIWLF